MVRSFHLPQNVQTDAGTHSATDSIELTDFFPVNDLKGREANWPLLYAKVKNVWHYTSISPNAFMHCTRTTLICICSGCSNNVKLGFNWFTYVFKLSYNTFARITALVNPLTPELNPSAQRCLMRFLLGILLLEPCILLIYAWKTNKCTNYWFSLLIMYGSSYMLRHYIAILRERS
jgi:hypothetical protein